MKGNDCSHFFAVGQLRLMILIPINTTHNQHFIFFSLFQVLNTTFLCKESLCKSSSVIPQFCFYDYQCILSFLI